MLLTKLINHEQRKQCFETQKLKLFGFEDEIWKKLKLCSVFVQNRENRKEKMKEEVREEEKALLVEMKKRKV